MLETNYFTPAQLVKMYPEIATQMNWTPGDIGYMCRMGLILGRSTKRKTLINKDSFLELVERANQVTLQRIVNL